MAAAVLALDLHQKKDRPVMSDLFQKVKN